MLKLNLSTQMVILWSPQSCNAFPLLITVSKKKEVKILVNYTCQQRIHHKWLTKFLAEPRADHDDVPTNGITAHLAGSTTALDSHNLSHVGLQESEEVGIGDVF